MKFTQETPTQVILIQGREFEVPMPFEEGHVLTAGEASALNQVFAENVRNNFATRLKRWEEARDAAKAEGKEFSEPEPSQEDLNKYMADYEFGVRRPGQRTSTDPVETEALALALAKVKEAVLKQGKTLKEVGAEKLRELAADAVERVPAFRERARQIVEARKAAAEGLDL